jgi:hypothetical protein
MDIKSILASVTAGLAVFTYFSLPILREMYGDIALLAVYAGLGLLSTVFVYTASRKIRDMDLSKSDKEYTIDEDTENKTEKNPKNDNDPVEKEIESLKE